MNAYIRAVTTLTADFTQTDRSGQTLTGKLTLKQPGKIRFQYQKGVPLLIVSYMRIEGRESWRLSLILAVCTTAFVYGVFDQVRVAVGRSQGRSASSVCS